MDKSLFKSKTFWLQVLGLVVVLVPSTHAFVEANLSAAGMGWAMINVVLRLITKDKVQIV